MDWVYLQGVRGCRLHIVACITTRVGELRDRALAGDCDCGPVGRAGIRQVEAGVRLLKVIIPHTCLKHKTVTTFMIIIMIKRLQGGACVSVFEHLLMQFQCTRMRSYGVTLWMLALELK